MNLSSEPPLLSENPAEELTRLLARKESLCEELEQAERRIREVQAHLEQQRLR